MMVPQLKPRENTLAHLLRMKLEQAQNRSVHKKNIMADHADNTTIGGSSMAVDPASFQQVNTSN